jgi:rRNA maturation endonuclease Nob1
VLPYELEYRQPSAQAMKVVTEFSRKTGDYASLSVTDLKVSGQQAPTVRFLASVGGSDPSWTGFRSDP